MNSLGQYIRDRRKAAGMQLKELAKLMGISNTFLSDMERGKNDISLSRLPQLAEILNLDICELQAREAISRGRVLLSSGRSVWRRVEELQDAA